MMRTFLTIAALVACAFPARAEPGSPPLVAAHLHRDGAEWRLEYVLAQDAPTWVFENSESVADGTGWRPLQWRVETPGVVLETLDGRDVLRSADGGAVPRRLSLRLKPSFVDLQSNYDPVLVFSNGSVAWFSEAFNLLPIATSRELTDLPDDLGPRVDGAGPAQVTWSDASGPVLIKGARRVSPVETRLRTYVLFGPAEVQPSIGLVTVADPGLPEWLVRELGEYAPRVGAVYSERLGPGADRGAMVMMSWSGPTAGMTSMAGSVLPGLVVMAFEGQGVSSPNQAVRNMARWFIGHESAHFWLGQTVRYATPADSWITEGGADLMAVRALEALDPNWSGQSTLQKSVDDCIALGDASVVGSAARGEFRAHYACGAVFALIAEAAQRRTEGGDWFTFLGRLIQDQRDKILTRDEWLSALDTLTQDPDLRRDIEQLLDAGSPKAADLISGLLERGGVPIRRDGGLVLLI